MAAVARTSSTSSPEPLAQDSETGWPLVVRLRPAVDLTEDQYFDLCQINHDLWIERNAEGDLLIMPPAGWETSDKEAGVIARLRVWAERDGSGVATGATAGFTLPDKSTVAPDAAWIRRSRLDQVPAPQRQKFLPLCPDFVVEIRSPSDTLRDQRNKMEAYIRNGAQLGWLLDPNPKHVYVYRPNAPVERLENPESISGDPVLPGFVLNLREIW